jgi:hypothetical protein
VALCSDGGVRVFTRAKERRAPEADLKAYEQELSNVKIQAPELQGLDVDRCALSSKFRFLFLL